MSYTMTEWSRTLLEEVRDMSPVTAGDIATALGWSHAIVRGRLRDLKRKGLVESEKHQRPIRVWMLTPEGEKAIA